MQSDFCYLVATQDSIISVNVFDYFIIESAIWGTGDIKFA